MNGHKRPGLINTAPIRFRLSVAVLIRSLALALVLLSPVFSLAQESDNPPPASEEPDQQAPGSTGVLDKHKAVVDSGIQAASAWVDSFFADPGLEADTANSLVRIRPEFYYRKEQGAKGKLKVSIKLKLPNLGRKTSLIIGNDDAVDDFGDNNEDSSSEPVVGLQFFGKTSKRWHRSLSAGIKFNEFAGYVGPRIRYLAPWGERKSVFITQTVRYQTNGYWNTVSRLDFNFITGGRFYFRQTFDGRWRGERSDDEGFRTRVSSVLTQVLSSSSGLQYDFSTIFHTRPESHVDRYTLSLRYRKRTSRDWLYYEIAPQVSFDHDYDYSFNPGIRLRVEFFYGAASSAEFSRRRYEDTEDFRW